MQKWFNVPTLLLDNYSSSLSTGFAVGLERLLSSYTGYCMRVERESDGVIVDVAFNKNILSLDSDITAVSGTTNATNLGQFMASSGYTDSDSKGCEQNGYCIKWYDQVNSNDFSMNTAGLKPIIVDAGVLKDSVTFDGSNDYMISELTTAIGTSDITVYCEFTTRDVTKGQSIWSKRLQGNTYAQLDLFLNNVAVTPKQEGDIVQSASDAKYYRLISGSITLSNDTMYKSKIQRTGTAFNGWLNGNSDFSATCYTTYNVSNTKPWTIGKICDASSFYHFGGLRALICGYSSFDIAGAGY